MNNHSCLLLTFFLSIQIFGSLGQGLPSYMTACRRNDPKLNECALKVAKATGKTFAKGDPSRNLPSMDPLVIKEIKTAAFGSNQDSGIKILFTDVSITGLKDLDIKKMVIDIEKHRFSAKATINLVMNSKYDLSGRLLIFPLVGKGRSHVELRDVKLSYHFNYDIVNRDGVEYLKYTTDDIKYDIGKASFRLENLFNGDKILGDATNTLLNENWKDVVTELGPPIVAAIKEGFKKAAVPFLSQVPYDELLLKS